MEQQTNKENTGFVVKNSPAEVEKHLRLAAANLCNIQPETVSFHEIIKLLEILEHQDAILFLRHSQSFKKYFQLDLNNRSNLSDEFIVRRISERSQSLRQFVEILSEHRVKGISYGIFAPSYLHHLRSFKEELKTDNCQSLLVGALTVDTVIEYQAVVHSIFPKASTHIIDLGSDQTDIADNFVLGDALSFPYADNSFDLVQTNYLLHCMSGKDNLSEAESSGWNFTAGQLSFLKEALRILKPGGRLLMAEGNLSMIIDDPSQLFLEGKRAAAVRDLRLALIASGFQPNDVEIDPAKSFVKRADMYQFFNSSVARIDDFKTWDSKDVFINAKKT